MHGAVIAPPDGCGTSGATLRLTHPAARDGRTAVGAAPLDKQRIGARRMASPKASPTTSSADGTLAPARSSSRGSSWQPPGARRVAVLHALR